MKKGLAILSAVMLLGTALTGCSGGKNATAESNGSAGPVTIKVSSWYKEGEGNWNKIIEAYSKVKPNVKVEFEPLVENGNATEAMKKLDLLASSGEALDVIMFSSAAEYAQRVGAGMTEPLDKYLEKDGINPKELFNVDTSINGQFHALPAKMNEWFVMLNKDMLDQAGLPVPKEWTWNDYAEYAKKLTKGEGAQKVYGSFLYTWVDFGVLALMNEPENPKLMQPDGTPIVNTPRVKYSLELRNKMENIDKSSVPYFEVISQKMAYRDVFYGGKAAMVPIGNWMVPELAQNAKFKTAFAPYPKYEEKDVNGYTSTGADFMSIAASSKHKQESYDFIKWYTTEGIEQTGKFFSSSKKADNNKTIDAMLNDGKPESAQLVDKTSLLDVLKVSKATKLIIPPSYSGQMEKEYITQMELYLTGKQDLNATLQNAEKKMADVRSSNK